MRLREIREFTGKITLKSGLHIGAGETEMRIGGTDNPVVKHPYTLEPYIPGSSLKGKVRALLEMKSGLMRLTGGKPFSASDLRECKTDEERSEGKKILKLFGASGADEEQLKEIGPTRVSFADAFLRDEWKKEVLEKQHASFTEIKAENSINRIKGTAEHPRFTERVPAGAEFAFCITLKVMEDEDEELEEYLLKGLRLLQMDSLGGNGSRGYGRIAITFDNEEIQQRFEQADPF